MSRSKILTIVLALLVMTLIGLTWYWRSQKPNKLDFEAYYPQEGALAYKTTLTMVEDRDGVRFLALVLTGPGNRITISEQSDKEREAYNTFVTSMENRELLLSRIGSGIVAISQVDKSTKLAAVHAGEATLFARSEQSLTKEDWRQIFDSLKPK